MPSIDKHWLAGKAFARSLQRAIDRNTIIDLLGIVEYDAQRMAHLEDAGFQDTMPAVECLFDYVLDALDVPPHGAEFDREPFEELFYDDYLLENRYPSLDAVIDALIELRDAHGVQARAHAGRSATTTYLNVVTKRDGNGAES